jgi:hypothetical protein
MPSGLWGLLVYSCPFLCSLALLITECSFSWIPITTDAALLLLFSDVQLCMEPLWSILCHCKQRQQIARVQTSFYESSNPRRQGTSRITRGSSCLGPRRTLHCRHGV